MFAPPRVGDKVGRQHVHVIAGADSLFLFFNLGFLNIRQLALDGLDCLGLIDGFYMDIHKQGTVQIEEVGQYPVAQLGRADLQE